MIKNLALAAIMALGTTVAANAALVYPSSVVSANQGVISPVATPRSATNAALGVRDGDFYSMGIGGELVLKFDTLVGGAGFVWEVTYGKVSAHKESADFYTSLDGITWSGVPVAVTLNADAIGLTGDALFVASPFKFLKIVDTSTYFKGRDGYDVDAVAFESYVAPVPVPAAGMLLLGGLGALGIAKRRKKA